MSFNGSGTYNLVYTWATEALTPPIPISKLDEQDQDIATALSNCLTRDGQSLPTADLPMNGKRLTNIGDATALTDALNRQAADALYLSAHASTTVNFLMTFTDGILLTDPVRITLSDLSQATDAKNWRIQASATSFQIGVLNDALTGGSFAAAISIGRSGVSLGAMALTCTTLKVNGNLVWHAGNDGAASTLDADLLDGQEGAFYQNAGNLNAGTLADARVAESNVTQHQVALTTRNITGKTGIAKTISTSAASGGADGDIWYQV